MSHILLQVTRRMCGAKATLRAEFGSRANTAFAFDFCTLCDNGPRAYDGPFLQVALWDFCGVGKAYRKIWSWAPCGSNCAQGRRLEPQESLSLSWHCAQGRYLEPQESLSLSWHLISYTWYGCRTHYSKFKGIRPVSVSHAETLPLCAGHAWSIFWKHGVWRAQSLPLSYRAENNFALANRNSFHPSDWACAGNHQTKDSTAYAQLFSDPSMPAFQCDPVSLSFYAIRWSGHHWRDLPSESSFLRFQYAKIDFRLRIVVTFWISSQLFKI